MWIKIFPSTIYDRILLYIYNTYFSIDKNEKDRKTHERCVFFISRI